MHQICYSNKKYIDSKWQVIMADDVIFCCPLKMTAGVINRLLSGFHSPADI